MALLVKIKLPWLQVLILVLCPMLSDSLRREGKMQLKMKVFPSFFDVLSVQDIRAWQLLEQNYKYAVLSVFLPRFKHLTESLYSLQSATASKVMTWLWQLKGLIYVSLQQELHPIRMTVILGRHWFKTIHLLWTTLITANCRWVKRCKLTLEMRWHIKGL